MYNVLCIIYDVCIYSMWSTKERRKNKLLNGNKKKLCVDLKRESTTHNRRIWENNKRKLELMCAQLYTQREMKWNKMKTTTTTAEQRALLYTISIIGSCIHRKLFLFVVVIFFSVVKLNNKILKKLRKNAIRIFARHVECDCVRVRVLHSTYGLGVFTLYI